jgi:DNA-binding MarR family transcriptional regulator
MNKDTKAAVDLIAAMTAAMVPSMPYNGTGGHAGSDTSKERAEREADDGTLAKRQREVMAFLWAQADRGATWAEVAEHLGIHHGSASGALSNLHKTGRIVRTTDRRGRSEVYMIAEIAATLPVTLAAPRANASKKEIAEAVAVIEKRLFIAGFCDVEIERALAVLRRAGGSHED